MSFVPAAENDQWTLHINVGKCQAAVVNMTHCHNLVLTSRFVTGLYLVTCLHFGFSPCSGFSLAISRLASPVLRQLV